MSNLAWGKPRLFIKEVGSTSWSELNTPVEDSTELQATKGDKLEAPIEGGSNEDVKYKDSTYAVVYNIRKFKGRAVPFPNTNGVASKHYAFMLMPEDAENIGFYIEDTSVTIDDTFTAADGAIWAIQHDAIAASSGNTVKWGTVAVSDGSISFTETQPAEDCEAISVSETLATE